MIQRTFNLFVGAAFFVSVLGCDSMQSPTAASKAAKDPLSEFKPITEKFIPAFNDLYKEQEGKLASVEEVSVTPTGAKFDVKKTDSVVSPYTGELHATGVLTLKVV